MPPPGDWSYGVPWLKRPLGPYRNLLYPRRAMGVYAVTGTFVAFGALVGLLSVLRGMFWEGGWAGIAVFGGIALVIWVLLRLPSVAFSLPKSVSFGANGIDVRSDTPFGAASHQMAYFDVYANPLSGDGSLAFRVRNPLLKEGNPHYGRSFGTFRLGSSDAEQISRHVPGFYPHSLVTVALWARKGLGFVSAILDPETNPRPALRVATPNGGVIVEAQGESVKFSVRIGLSAPSGQPNPFASLADKDRQELGTFLRQAAREIAPVTARTLPVDKNDISEMDCVELSGLVNVNRDDPVSIGKMEETIKGLDAEARRLVEALRARLRTVRQGPGSSPPPPGVYG